MSNTHTLYKYNTVDHEVERAIYQSVLAWLLYLLEQQAESHVALDADCFSVWMLG